MNRMARIPTRGTRPERLLVDAVRRVYDGPLLTNVAGLPGTPDVVLPEKRVILAALGCFWHWHPADGCPIAHLPPIGPTGFDWTRKLATNRQRDARNRTELIAKGYRVAWCWECALIGRAARCQADIDAQVAEFIGGPATSIEIAG
jgi:DNA mismatch endonuclease (patch repair protein)